MFSLRYSLSVLALSALVACDRTDAPATTKAPPPSAALLTPDPAALAAAAPDSFNIIFNTSKGEVEVAVRRQWAPNGVDRLHYLTTSGFFTGMRFYRVMKDFVAQFGLSGYPAVNAVFDTLTIKDDPAMMSNAKGTLVFAANGPNTRTTELFFNLVDNTQLDGGGSAPLGRIVRGMDVAAQLFSGHGQGLGPGRIRAEGDAYLDGFPQLDFIVGATVTP